MHLHAWLSPIITASRVFTYLVSCHNDDAEHAIPPLYDPSSALLVVYTVCIVCVCALVILWL